ncbi:MAG: ChaN family lipoprotein [Variovorax sp.]
MALLPADALLLGEQHDAPEHQAIALQTVEALAASGRLAALAIEMAEEGNATAHLPATATDAQVQAALSWDDKAWPWSAYGPAVMAAVRAGVPVVGANLPRERMKDAMADVSLDAQLGADAREAQQEAVRSGHCKLLPEAQIGPMTRIQIARDRAMAQAIVNTLVPGKTVVLLSGAGHATRLLGVPQHLPSDLTVKTVQLRAGAAAEQPGAFDAVWLTPALPVKDYCGTLRRAS